MYIYVQEIFYAIPFVFIHFFFQYARLYEAYYTAESYTTLFAYIKPNKTIRNGTLHQARKRIRFYLFKNHAIIYIYTHFIFTHVDIQVYFK